MFDPNYKWHGNPRKDQCACQNRWNLVRLGALSVTLAILVLVGGVFAAESSTLAPVPSADEQAKAEKLIKDIFKADVSKAKSVADKLALAEKFIKLGIDTKEDAAGRYVFFRLASELAAQSGNHKIAFQALDELAKEYEVDELALKTAVVTSTAKQSPTSGLKELTEAILSLVDQSISADRFDEGLRLTKLADSTAWKSKDALLTKKANAAVKKVQKIQKEYEGVKSAMETLKEKPDDTDASASVGRFLCLMKGDWSKGLPLLAKGSNNKLRALAEKDLAEPSNDLDQMKLGDEWWDLAEAENEASMEHIKKRAAGWYEKSLPSLTGLNKAKVEKRIAELGRAEPKTGAGDNIISELHLVPGGISGRTGAAHDELLRKGGGNEKSEAAVALGLKWIVRQQTKEGSWLLQGYDPNFGRPNPVAGTALALLPLLGSGSTHQKGPYAATIKKGLTFLQRRQKPTGDFGGGMYAQGFCTLAVCEAFGLSGDSRLKKSAQAAINYLVWAQHPAGGWRYNPGQPGDTSVTGWQFMALKTGQMAGLTVPKNTMLRISKFLDSVQGEDDGYGYDNRRSSFSCSAIGLLCRLYQGWEPSRPELVRGLEVVVSHPPSPTLNSSYYYYYATELMHHLGGAKWEEWNVKMRDLLIERQENDSANRNTLGSWSPVGEAFGIDGGRLMVTSFSLLTLEAYYRHVPLYLADKVGGKDDAGKSKSEPKTGDR